ncbi:hypothetical protein M422DRAFT_199508 [Sphaerobolus stellatus SS14]|nr:hypothetical protein M422DRAFT_199508 [Sphaerobolus stellatus SS14]
MFPEWLQTLASVGMAVGPPLVYADQTYSIIRKRDSTGFSRDVCGILLIANITRCFYWLRSQFEFALLVQSMLMIAAQLFLVYICLRFRPALAPESLGVSSRPFSFWQWSHYRNYIEFLAGLILLHAILYLIFGRQDWYTSLLGFLALGIESLLPVPQLISNFQQRSLWGFRMSTLLGWLGGDTFKTAYFFVQQSPLPFKVGAIFQVTVDCAIVVQKLVYGSPPPPTVLEEDDLEQALALETEHE